MPFPLAHPAAVLPLRRYCPRRLNFPALIIGSLTPDLGYLFGRLHVDWFSHLFWAGSFGFSLPVGLQLVLLFYQLRSPVVRILPARFRRLFLPLCQRPAGHPLPIAISLLIGAWTHIFLDSVAHEDGWLVERLALLRRSLPGLGSHRIEIYAVLYSSFTFLGAAWLALHYVRWVESCRNPHRARLSMAKWIGSLLFAGATLLLAHASRSPDQVMGIIPAGIISVLLVVVGIALIGGVVAPK